MSRADGPVRHRLFVRLLAGSIIVAMCTIAATAWLAARSTTGSIEREQGQALSTDAHIYDTVLAYAATHSTWDGVEARVRALAAQSGRRIAITTEQRTEIADSAAGRARPVRASSVIDPLQTDPSLNASVSRIDPRAAGPYRLPSADRIRLRTAADTLAKCLRGNGIQANVVESPTGRARVTGYNRVAPTACPVVSFEGSTPTEQRALDQLRTLAAPCLKPAGQTATPRLSVDATGTPVVDSTVPSVVTCLNNARRAQLRPYVAAPALLFITQPAGEPSPSIRLSSAGTTRIALAGLVILVLAALISALIAARLLRPVHALTLAAQRMQDGDTAARVQVRARGELGQLSRTFNQMSEHLERTEQQRRNMVSDISHELRSPLANVRGWLEATQDGVADLDPALVTLLLDETLTLQHLVDDLQDLAEADAGQLHLHREPVDITDLLESVRAAHRTAATSANVVLSAEITDGAEVFADPVRLRQAVSNLVSNAIRHTPAGGHVTLRAQQHTDQVMIEVTDTGGGISAEDLPHVFDRFWRADKSRSRHTGGSGLGLTIAKRLVEAHAGTLTATSEPDVATSFTITLPSHPGLLAEDASLSRVSSNPQDDSA
ncbi:sensor histidine kinase [Luteipulveratus mongoliensis]|uniref:histidine kinase n=1 Tax=Luteipulveratus mongoliensis TaxID=571913 RepID=A0A0K1JDW7_9MICO|nr:ATP-binding protein [Luteipulveratus mongoliensis]AKU14899.1 hypothetical protein VV02_01840 [Luteipulveratus mongoliensis]